MIQPPKKPQSARDEAADSAERRERAEMFTFHPAILRGSVGLPRPTTGGDYDMPAGTR